MRAERPAGVCDGMQAFALGGADTERCPKRHRAAIPGGASLSARVILLNIGQPAARKPDGAASRVLRPSRTRAGALGNKATLADAVSAD